MGGRRRARSAGTLGRAHQGLRGKADAPRLLLASLLLSSPCLPALSSPTVAGQQSRGPLAPADPRPQDV